MIKCLFGHKWKGFYKIVNGNPVRFCMRCNKEEHVTQEEYCKKQLENTKELVHSIETCFRIIDVQMVKGFYSNTDKSFDLIYKIIVETKTQYSEHFNLIKESVENGINYIKRPIVKNPFEYETRYNGVYFQAKVGPEYIPPHIIPESINKQFERLKNEL